MTFRPHQHSDKTPEELAAQRARRLQNKIARALLKEDAAGQGVVDEAVQVLRESMNDKSERRATRDNAAISLLREANKAAGNIPQFTLNQGAVVDAAGLLRLVQSEQGGHTTGGTRDLSTPPDTIGLPNPVPSDEPRSPRAGVTGDHEAKDGPPAGASSGDAPEATTPALASPVAAETVGDGLLRCPDCHATWEDGHERACPVPKEEA